MKAKRGQILKELRKAKGLNQSYFSEMLGISLTAYQKYEHGTAEPNFDNLSKLADFYGVTTDYLLGRETRDPETPIAAFAKEANLKELEEVLITKYLELSDKQRESVMEFLRNAIAEETARKSESVQSNAQKESQIYISRTAARNGAPPREELLTQEEVDAIKARPDADLDL